MKRRSVAITLVLIGTAAFTASCERRRDPNSTDPAHRSGHHGSRAPIIGAGRALHGGSGGGNSVGGAVGGVSRGGFGGSGHAMGGGHS